MHTLRLTLEYDGTDYSGWQRQPGRSTVEGVLRQAIATVTGELPRLTAAGRTDAGAHAHGQVVGCSLSRPWDPARLIHALNHALPNDVVVTAAAEVEPDFHARRDALSRTYQYVVVPRPHRSPLARRYAWHVRGDLDVEAMRRAARALTGTHDFAAFGRAPKPGGSTVRTVSAVSVRRAELPSTTDPGMAVVIIEVVANAFLYGMMRSFAGALVEVGQGNRTLDELESMISAPSPTGRRATVGPAHGLHQWKVTYE